MTLENLQDLYLEELRDVYDAEHQLLKALKQLGEAAKHQPLEMAFERHLRQTQEQIARLETVFRQNKVEPERKPCKAMKGLIAESKEMIEEDADDDVRDAGLIAAAQRAEHYEISAYGTLCAYAEMLGRPDDLKLLKKTLSEEKATDQKLTKLAMTVANPAAMDGRSNGSSNHFQDMTKVELYEWAQEQNVPGRSKMGKKELVKALQVKK